MMNISDAFIVVHLHIRVKQANQAAFGDYLREALPIFESIGDCQGAVYSDAADPECFDEVFYYASEAAYAAAERAIRENPREIALLARWRALLAEPPKVVLERRWMPAPFP
jgi:hypothetical protein